MNHDKTVQFHRRANMALTAFAPGVRERIERTLQDLAAHPKPFERVDVRRIAADEPVYLLRVAPEVRAIFEETATGFEVQDVVRTDTLESFARHDSRSSRLLPQKLRRKRPTYLEAKQAIFSLKPTHEND